MALATEEWIQLFPYSHEVNLVYNYSDHCPLLLNVFDYEPLEIDGCRPFSL